jgi:hypothetical protein
MGYEQMEVEAYVEMRVRASSMERHLYTRLRKKNKSSASISAAASNAKSYARALIKIRAQRSSTHHPNK